jgi:hypothetical protein
MTVQWLGSARSGRLGQLISCGTNREAYWDVSAREMRCRDITVAGGIELRQCPPDQGSSPAGCVPIECPSGTVRNTDDGSCLPICPQGQVRSRVTGQCETAAAPTIPPPAPGECLSAQQVIAAQPCFYFNAQGEYVGPPELVQGVDTSALFGFCLQSLAAGYFELPLCDAPATIPAPPSCLTPEQRGIVRYCREMDQRPIADTRRGWNGPNRTANYFCWTAFKALAEFGEWEAAPDCQPGVPPVTPPVEVPPGEPSVPGSAPAPIAKKSSAVVPLLVGAAVVGAAVYFLS